MNLPVRGWSATLTKSRLLQDCPLSAPQIGGTQLEQFAATDLAIVGVVIGAVIPLK